MAAAPLQGPTKGGETGSSDDAIWDRRHQHRRAGLARVCQSEDVTWMYALIAAGELPAGGAPMPPDPNDRSVSKRQWELGTIYT